MELERQQLLDQVLTVIHQLPSEKLVEVGKFLGLYEDAATTAPDQPATSLPTGPVTLGRYRGQFWMADDFNDELPDSFWLGDDDDPLYA